jgi:hypothetical protein
MSKEPINRDPYCAVQLSNVEHGGKATDKWLVELENETGELVPLPGVSGVHGADYALVPNQQIHDMVDDVLTRTGHTFKPVPGFSAGQSKAIYWDGAKRFSAKWYCEEIAESMPGGHAMALGVEAVNSYDGSQPVGVRFFAMNMLCANQFYASNMLGNFIFRHINREAGIQLQDNVEDALRLLQQQADRFLNVMPVFKQLQETPVRGMAGYLDYRAAINTDCWKRTRDPDVLDELQHCGVTKEYGLAQAANHEDLWGILNAYTAVCTHTIGGFNGSSTCDRVTQFTISRAGIRVPRS